MSLNVALGAGEAGHGVARVSDDVYPTAAIKINGLTPNGPILADHDLFGISVASMDLDGDGVPDLAAGDSGDLGTGTVHVMLMNADGTVKSTSEINATTPNGPVLVDYGQFGVSVASIGDIDGDGVPDLAAGAHGNRGSPRGTVHIILMNADGTVKSTSEINDTTPNGPVLADHDHFGSSVTLLGDLDGDGVPDLAVGAYHDNAGGTWKGTVHIMLMNADGTVKSTSEINDTTPNGPVLDDHDSFGRSITSMGDLDGDGVPDLAVGSYFDNGEGTNRGAVHIMLMNADGTVKSTSEINDTTPNGPVLADHDHFGAAVASMGDLDGDGVPDLAVGAYGDDGKGVPGDDGRGAVHIMLMNADGTVKSTSEINGTTPNGPVLDDHDNFGRSVASMGDFDGDGVTDLVAGIYAGSDAGGINRGAVHVVTLGVVPTDRTPPALTDVVLDVRTGVLTLTFNETIDVTPPDNVRLDSIFISGGAGATNRTALTGAALNSTSDDSALTITLTVAQLRSAAALAAPQLDIEAGAVRDMSAIYIEASEGNPVTVLGSVPPVAPAAPANLTATSTIDSVTLTWDGPGDDSITGYKILSRMSSTQSELGVLVADTGSVENTYTANNLDHSTEYAFGVVAFNDHGESQISQTAISTKSPPPPAAPANLTATSAIFSVTISWDDPNDDTITGYRILSRIPATQPDLHTLVNDTGSADSSYTAQNLESGTAYIFRITAMNNHGESEMSDPASVSTLPNSPPISDAGLDQTVRPGQATTLNGTASYDPDGHTISHSWNQTMGPDVALSGADTDSPTFEAPAVANRTVLVFQLTVSDGRLASGDAVDITIQPDRPPAITLVGQANMTISIGSAYTEPGYTATDDTDGDITANVTVSGTVDVNTTGTYTIQYDVSDSSGNAATTQTRTVHVTDTTPPAITLSGSANMTISVGSAYTEPGYTATDDYDGNITGNVVVTGTVDTATLGTYTIQYDVSDSSGNAATTQTRTVHVTDTTPPAITLSGSANMTISVGSAYTEPGYTATDDYDGTIRTGILPEM